MSSAGRRAVALALAVLAGGTAGCHGCEQPAPLAVVDLSDPFLRDLTPTDLERLVRHLASSPRWEVREEQGHRVAVRRERAGGSCDACALPGGFRTSLNGFYTPSRAQDLQQTRVRLGFGKAPPTGKVRVTEAQAGQGEVGLVPSGQRGEGQTETWLRVTGAGGALHLEVMEQAGSKERRFTRSALAQVQGELARALEDPDTLDREGHVPALWPEGAPPRGSPFMEVADGLQPGIYVVTAWANPGEPGRAFVRVFHEGALPEAGAAAREVTRKGQGLSVERVRGRTTRVPGWSAEQDVLFPYQAELTVYEGDWEEPYGARFELRFVGQDGQERTLAQASRTITGWMQ